MIFDFELLKGLVLIKNNPLQILLKIIDFLVIYYGYLCLHGQRQIYYSIFNKITFSVLSVTLNLSSILMPITHTTEPFEVSK